ncbi:hypothetical protein HPB49_023137 [Dermacentor silvarum]|uniref:Uncharacterized protein n=1 Tax=Dermacentor silvarum TaxID=543639 RepID=A0ACB8C5S8_DERSI|nr:hypothetical protein HPB49_023137 [Dermacentor silvarum]
MDLLLPRRLAGIDLRTSESFDCEEGFGHGPFQKRMLLLILLGAFLLKCQTIVVSLVTGDVDHWCKPLAGFNISAADWKNIAIPIESDGRFSHCRIYERCKPPAEPDYPVEHGKSTTEPATAARWYQRCFFNDHELQDTNDTRDVPCDDWDYDVRTAETTAVSFWNMVCHRRFLPAALVTLQNAGALVALVLIGAFVDYVGRRVWLLGTAVAVVTCTVSTLVATSYVHYAVARFPYRGQCRRTHGFRLPDPIRGSALCEVWIVIVKSIVIDWRLKQIIFLAPTALLLPALFTARESPRWLVSKGRLDAAEAVMMEGAKTNNFPIAVTACLVENLREQIENRAGQEGADADELIDCRSLRRRALAMFSVCFSISLVYYVNAFSTAQWGGFWIPGLTVAVTLLTYAAMHFLMTGVTLITVLTSCFLLTGVIQCAMSITAGAGLITITNVLLVLSKGASTVIYVHCFTYVAELFPSAVRGGALCWAFACGRAAAMCAAVTFVLKPTGHEDVVFGVTGLFLFASLLVIRALPRTTVVEDAKIVARDASDSTRIALDHMKRTLEQHTWQKTAKTASLESSKSSNKKSRKSVGSSSLGSSKTHRGFRTDRIQK